MFKSCIFLLGALAVGTTPSRSMAQGLVKPTSPNWQTRFQQAGLGPIAACNFSRSRPIWACLRPAPSKVDSYRPTDIP